MKTVWNSYRNEQPYSNHMSSRESFEQHDERMRIFRRTHDLAQYAKRTTALCDTPTRIELIRPKSGRDLLILLHLRYVLKLVHANRTVILPRNSQN